MEKVVVLRRLPSAFHCTKPLLLARHQYAINIPARQNLCMAVRRCPFQPFSLRNGDKKVYKHELKPDKGMVLTFPMMRIAQLTPADSAGTWELLVSSVLEYGRRVQI